MRDDHMGGLLAFIIAAPVLLVCCGGGGVVLAALLGGLGGWLSGIGGIAMAAAALGGVLLWREIRRRRGDRTKNQDSQCCAAQTSRDPHLGRKPNV